MSTRDSEARSYVAEGIYGQILVTSVVAALSEDESASSGEILGGVVVTLLVFWLAHVYARAVSQRIEHGGHLRWRELRAIMRFEWPIVEAGFPTIGVLLLGWAGVVSTDTAVAVAIVLGVAGLAGLGFLIGRRSNLSAIGTLGTVLLSGAFGLLIVMLKVVVH